MRVHYLLTTHGVLDPGPGTNYLWSPLNGLGPCTYQLQITERKFFANDRLDGYSDTTGNINSESPHKKEKKNVYDS